MIKIQSVTQAHKLQKESGLNFHTPLQKSLKLSEQYGANVYFKREDQHLIRVFKMRSAYNAIFTLTQQQKDNGIVTVSDGNFAQAMAFFCHHLKIKGIIYVPEVCYSWKVELIQKYGKQFVEVRTEGENLLETYKLAKICCEENNHTFVHPADNLKALIGNGTMGIEIMEDLPGDIDYIFIPVGQGALAAGVAGYLKAMAPGIKTIGVQPSGAESMIKSFEAKEPIVMDTISRFCDGSAVPTVPKLTLDICMQNLDELIKVEEGKISTTVLQLYNSGIAVEPAGALGVAALDQYAEQIKGKNVVCIISGGTVDLSRFDEFKEYSLLYEGLKYFFLIQMPLKPGILRMFVEQCLGPDDEVSHVQFQKKANREKSPCLVAIEVTKKENIKQVMEKMKQMKLDFQLVNESKELYDLLV